jgi:hypothetical protein
MVAWQNYIFFDKQQNISLKKCNFVAIVALTTLW